VDEQRGGAVGAHATERRSDIDEADVVVAVADGARGGIDGAAAGEVAGLLDLGRETGDELVLLEGDGVEFGHQRGGLAGEIAIRVSAEAGDVAEAEAGGIDAALGEISEEQSGEFDAAEDLVERRGRARAGPDDDHRAAGVVAADCPEGGEQGRLQFRRSARGGQQGGDPLEHGGAARGEGEQAERRFETVRLRGVGGHDAGEQAGGEGIGEIDESVVAVVADGERQGGDGGAGALEEAAQRGEFVRVGGAGKGWRGHQAAERGRCHHRPTLRGQRGQHGGDKGGEDRATSVGEGGGDQFGGMVGRRGDEGGAGPVIGGGGEAIEDGASGGVGGG
jgi:hypothetical protein